MVQVEPDGTEHGAQHELDAPTVFVSSVLSFCFGSWSQSLPVGVNRTVE